VTVDAISAPVAFDIAHELSICDIVGVLVMFGEKRSALSFFI